MGTSLCAQRDAEAAAEVSPASYLQESLSLGMGHLALWMVFGDGWPFFWAPRQQEQLGREDFLGSIVCPLGLLWRCFLAGAGRKPYPPGRNHLSHLACLAFAFQVRWWGMSITKGCFGADFLLGRQGRKTGRWLPGLLTAHHFPNIGGGGLLGRPFSWGALSERPKFLQQG